MSIDVQTKEEAAYKLLVEDIKKIISECRIAGQLALSIEYLRMKWKIGDRILLYQKSGKTQIQLATMLANDICKYLGIKPRQQRISEFVQFRLKVGENFDRWVNGVTNSGEVNIARRDIQYFIFTRKDPTPEDEQKKLDMYAKQKTKRDKEDADLVAKTLENFKLSDLYQSIDMLTNKVIEGYQFSEGCIGLLKSLADAIRERYPDE